MRKSLTICLAIALTVFLLESTLASVVINEVEQNPPGDENARKAADRAWIELYNNDDKDVNIGGWSINTSVGRALIPKGAIIRGLDYYVMAAQPRFLVYSGEILVLLNDTGGEVDRTPQLSDDPDDDLAWTRDPDGRDTDSSADWKLLPSSSGF